MSQKKSKVTVERTDVKNSYMSRIECGEVVGLNGPKSEIWKANTVLQDLGQKLVAAGTALKTANGAANALEKQASEARGLRDTRSDEFDSIYELYATTTEAHAKSPADVAGLGLEVLVQNSYPLAPPLEVKVRFDEKAGLIRTKVKRAPGIRACIVEISSNPDDPAGWKRLPGVGAVHALSGYAPGTYWIRVASACANEQSRFTTPVSVIVK